MIKIERIEFPEPLEPEQGFSSANTSVNAKSGKVPAVFNKKKFSPGKINLDVGGGQGDMANDILSSSGSVNLVYDPYNRSSSHNAEVIEMVRDNDGADSVTCSNVLNVIDNVRGREIVIRNCHTYLKDGAFAYFTTYEGNKTGVGKTTLKNSYQTNMVIDDYKDEIEKVFGSGSVQKKNGMLIAKK